MPSLGQEACKLGPMRKHDTETARPAVGMFNKIGKKIAKMPMLIPAAMALIPAGESDGVRIATYAVLVALAGITGLVTHRTGLATPSEESVF